MLKHNKKRNTFIIYEQLISLALRLSLAKKHEESNAVLSVLKEAFNKNTLLYKEKKLFDTIIKTNALTKEDSINLLEETLKEVKSIDGTKLDFEKTKLIKNITNKISKKLFDVPVKNYKLLASTQILFNESRNEDQTHTTPKERIKIKKILTEQMTKVPPKKQEEKVDNLTYSLVIRKYNEKYSKLVNEDQKELLKEWINFLISENVENLEKLIESKKRKIKGSLRVFLENSEVKKYKDYGLIKEAFSKIDSFNAKEINEDSLYKLMKYFDLKEDLETYVKEERD